MTATYTAGEWLGRLVVVLFKLLIPIRRVAATVIDRSTAPAGWQYRFF